MQCTWIRLYATAAIMIFGLAGCPNNVIPEIPWHGKQSIETEGDVGSYISLHSNGPNLNVSFYDSTNSDLKFTYSEDEGATWPADYIKTVDSAGDVGQFVDMDGACIAYYDNTNRDLKFAKCEVNFSGNWTWAVRTVDSAGDIGQSPSISTYGSYVYISYYDATAGVLNGDLKFARSDDGGATWPAGNIQTVDSTGAVGVATSLAVDGEGRVFIAYFDYTHGDLKFASSPGSEWPIDIGTIKTIDSAGFVGGGPDLAVDISDDSLYVTYYDSTNGNLKLAKSTDHGATWTSGTVDSAGDVGVSPSIAVFNGTVYICYRDVTNASLKMARSTDGGATGDIQTVDTGNVGSSSAIAFHDTTVFIVYYDASNGDLKFAKSIDGGATW